VTADGLASRPLRCTANISNLTCVRSQLGASSRQTVSTLRCNRAASTAVTPGLRDGGNPIVA
jgi:hypothetical protein